MKWVERVYLGWVLILVAGVCLSPALVAQDDPASEATSVVTDQLVSDEETLLSTEPEASGTEIPRLNPGDTIYLSLVVKTDESGAALDSESGLEPVPLPQVPDTKIFTLDKEGVLFLPAVGGIPLAGLSESEAVLRIKAEPLFEPFEIDLVLLPVEPTGGEALERFGQELFKETPGEFSAATNIPIPPDYVIGPEDSVVVQLYGQEAVTYTLVVNRDGVIDLPGIGPITVAGLTFSKADEYLKARINRQLIGVKVYITLGALRSIAIFVVGDAANPGAYQISALSNISHALFTAGGPSQSGSMRDIQLKRKGELITHFDLYDFLLGGDTGNDVRLQSGDVIFIPPSGPSAGVTGEIRRPAIYEFRNSLSVTELIRLAGGLLSSADPKMARVERIDADHQRKLLEINLSHGKNRNYKLQDGDVVTIPTVLEKVRATVQLTGHVYRPGEYQWRPGMKLSDLIPPDGVLLPRADLDYLLIRREQGLNKELEVVSARLSTVFADLESEENIDLMPDDEVVVFASGSVGERQLWVAPLVSELRSQVINADYAQVVEIGGHVRDPGEYPLEKGMRVSDLVRAAGKLNEEAGFTGTELTRYTLVNGVRRIEHLPVDLKRAMAADPSADIPLQPHDFLVIKSVPYWGNQLTVELSGEVMFPGVYPIARGEQLSQVILRAGGLTDLAFAEGAVLSRVELKRKEEEHMQALANRLEIEMRATLIERRDSLDRPGETAEIVSDLIQQLRNYEAVGRMIFDLKRIVKGGANDHSGSEDVTLRGGDQIHVPLFDQQVMIVGEVYNPISVIFQKNLDRKDYISLCGGLTRKADKRRTYVIRPNGAIAGTRSDIRPGDIIVVPLNSEKLDKLSMWKDISSIFSQIAFGAAALETLRK